MISDNNILHICGYEGAKNDLTIYKDYDAKAYNWAVNVENISLSQGREIFKQKAIIGGFPNTDKGKQVKKVYVAQNLNYVPYSYVNDRNEPDGFEVQVLKEIDKLLEDYEFEFIPTSDDDLLIGVETGKCNVGVKGAWYTEERSKQFLRRLNNDYEYVI